MLVEIEINNTETTDERREIASRIMNTLELLRKRFPNLEMEAKMFGASGKLLVHGTTNPVD